ncbi:MAG TPA: triple tyrosine motif-containing protein, partial [Saprospiraceae bacterium]|nr:triple tyrosine motif-containing protein [Saprospiraceae bacterium]
GTEVGLEHYAPATVRFGRAMIPLEKDMNQFSLVSSVVRDNTDAGGQRYFVGVWGTGLFAWNKIDGTFVRMKPARSKLTANGIFKLIQDRRGCLWECLNYGVRCYNPRTGTWRDYEKMFQHPERSNAFVCGLEDRRDNLWFGSNKEGLFRFNARTNRVEQAFCKKEFVNEKGYLNISDMSEDEQGRLWLACNSSGLVCFDPATGASKQFFYPEQDIPAACNAVKVASNGRIYAAFYGAFLELDPEGKLLRYFTRQNKLKANRLFFIVEDRQGKIWFNSEYLLHCFDPVSGDVNYYGKPDGLFGNTMTDALSITPDGEIFVGFQNAFNFFYPDRLRRNLQPPPIAITSIKVMNKEREIWKNGGTNPNNGLFSSNINRIEHDSLLVLRPGENFFEIEFAALNFNQQERNRYAYKLEGFNDDWVFTERPVATFTNLDGGDYLLRMKAANNDGVWNERGATLAIRVIPPFYKTWWFYTLMALATAGIVAALLWFRWRQQRRLEKFRESLARDLHDEMGSTLSSIFFFSEFASRQIGDDKPAVTPVLQRIGQSASALSESMQDIIWAMKTQNDQLEDLTARMTEFGFGLLEARNMDFKTHISVDFSGKQLPPQVRRNVYLIFKEALNNASKYAKASEVELHFAMKKGLLLMKISDNGLGFEMDSQNSPLGAGGGSGNGLQNMRKRAADIGGKLEIVSKPGAGTRVELRVKI